MREDDVFGYPVINQRIVGGKWITYFNWELEPPLKNSGFLTSMVASYVHISRIGIFFFFFFSILILVF